MHWFETFWSTISPEKYEHLLSIPQEKVFSWLESGLNILPNFIVAIITLLLFYPFAKLAKFLTGKMFRKNLHNTEIRELCKNIVFLIIFLIGLFSALEILNLEKTVASLLAGAGVIGLALGLAFQEIASNFASGILIAFRKPYHVGDIIEVQGRVGSVKSIDLRTTSLMTGQGLEVIIPNKSMITDTIINYTSTPERCVEINVGVSYREDLEKVKSVTLKAIESIPLCLKSRPVEFYYDSFGASAIHFKVRFWVSFPGDTNYDRAIHQAIMNIKNAFDQNKITIPFPTQTLDFGDNKILEKLSTSGT